MTELEKVNKLLLANAWIIGNEPVKMFGDKVIKFPRLSRGALLGLLKYRQTLTNQAEAR